MSQDIRFAGLNERLYRQLLQTLHFLSTPGEKARIGEWNGRHCDVVVADSRNQFGEYVINTAGQRGIPLVAVTRC